MNKQVLLLPWSIIELRPEVTHKTSGLPFGLTKNLNEGGLRHSLMLSENLLSCFLRQGFESHRRLLYGK